VFRGAGSAPLDAGAKEDQVEPELGRRPVGERFAQLDLERGGRSAAPGFPGPLAVFEEALLDELIADIAAAAG
jgi:hypothetical protein